jgi:hypothetical protein
VETNVSGEKFGADKFVKTRFSFHPVFHGEEHTHWEGISTRGEELTAWNWALPEAPRRSVKKLDLEGFSTRRERHPLGGHQHSWGRISPGSLALGEKNFYLEVG